MDSIITQVNREDEQLNAFANDKGKADVAIIVIVQIFVLMKKEGVVLVVVLHYPGLLNSLEETRREKISNVYNVTSLL